MPTKVPDQLLAVRLTVHAWLSTDISTPPDPCVQTSCTSTGTSLTPPVPRVIHYWRPYTLRFAEWIMHIRYRPKASLQNSANKYLILNKYCEWVVHRCRDSQLSHRQVFNKKNTYMVFNGLINKLIIYKYTNVWHFFPNWARWTKVTAK